MRKRIYVESRFEQGVPEIEMGHSRRRHAVVLSADSDDIKRKGHPKPFHETLQPV
jgi:hypothetical protein